MVLTPNPLKEIPIVKAIRKISVVIIVCLFSSVSVFSQASDGSGKDIAVPGVFESKFLRDSLVLDEKGFAFNSLTLKNLSASKLDVIISADLKEKIQSVNPIPQNITLQAGEIKVIPLRFNLTSSSVVSGTFAVRFSFQLPASSRTVYNEFSVRVQKNTKWRSSVDKSTLIFKGAETSLPFNVTIDNRGNAEETYDFSFVTPDQLTVKAQKKSITVGPNQSKTLEFTIVNSTRVNLPINIQNATVEVYVKNGNDSRRYNIELVKLGSVYTEYLPRMKKIPLTVELNTMNLGNANPYIFGRLYGTLDLNEHEKLKLYYQSDNYFKTGKSESFVGFAEYSNSNFSLHLGSIQEFNNFQVDGVGARFEVRSRHHETTGYVVSGRNQTTQVASLDNMIHIGKKWTNITRGMYYDDKLNLLKSGVAENELGVAIDKNTSFGILAGGSLERTDRKIQPEQQRGYLIGYKLDHAGEKLTYNSTIKRYSDGYAGFNKGFNFQQHRVKYQSRKFFTQASFDLNVRSQKAYTEFGLKEFFNLDSKVGSVVFGWMTNKGSFSAGPGFLLTKQDSLSSFVARSSVMNVNIFYSFGNTGVLSLISQTGYTSVPRSVYDKKVLISSSFGTVSSKNFGLQYRFDHGPIYYYEVTQFVKNPTLNTTRYQLSPYYEFTVPKLNLTSRIQYTVNRELISAAKDDYLFYHFQFRHPKSKWEFFVSGQYNLADKNRSFTNISYRRQLFVPVVKNKKIKSASFVFYKDVNNNGAYDAGDQLLTDMQMFANKSLLLTDKAGAVQIANTDDDVFNVDFTVANNTQGWIPVNGLKQSFSLKSKLGVTYIPFKKGKLLKGIITVSKDANSGLDFSVANIRVTAEGTDGNKYTAITNDKGEFYFNVVSGTYIVSLPQVFDDVFRPVEFVKSADLILNETFSVVFEVRQKKRNVNIKKN